MEKDNELEQLKEIYDEAPTFSYPHMKGSPGTDMLLRHGVITEEEVNNEDSFTKA